MDEKDIKSVEAQIEIEIKRAELDIVDYKEATKPISPENAIGRISRMDAINNKSVLEAALRKAEEKLKGLKYLKGKLNDPDFGNCAQCGTQIPLQRMLFMPQSPFCVNCAS